MIDLLFQVGFSNVLLSLALAIAALIVGVTFRRPQLSHLLWLLVLVKLVTPPVVTIPNATIPEQFDRTVISMKFDSQPNSNISGIKGDVYHSAETWFAALDHRKNGMLLIWLLGSVVVFALSLARVYRFNSLLRVESEVAPQELQAAAAGIANQLNLKTVPTIYTTLANLSPMVWWIGGKVRVVIPTALFKQIDTHQFQWILAHELAHVRRRDYLVRWIEWLVCVCFWWNPVAYWARYNLRANEELCCDALVVSSLKLRPQTYADSLLKVFEYLASPVIRPPAMASEIKSGGFLERRFKKIVSGSLNRKTSRWLLGSVLLFALAVLSLGIGCERGDTVTDSAGLIESSDLRRGGGERDAGIENHFSRLGISTEMLDRIKIALKERGITADEPVPGGMLRVIYELREEGEDFELDPRMRDYFENRIGLTGEQIEYVVGFARRIVHSLRDSDRRRGEGERDIRDEDHYNRIGVNREALDRIRRHLQENGLTHEQAEPVLRRMLRVIIEMRSEGEDFELDPRLRGYFGEIGLTNEQIELVQGIARRIVQSRSDSDRERGEDERVAGIEGLFNEGPRLMETREIHLQFALRIRSYQ